jgi:hypothetical protein
VWIERDLEVLCLLEVQVFTSGAFLEALLEPWRSFEELWWSFYWKQLENKQEMKASRFMKWNNCIN